MPSPPEKNQEKEIQFSKLKDLLADKKRLLIVLHNNPDPDALASAFALRFLADRLYGIETSIAYGGIIGRAENSTMVRLLKIPLHKINRITFESYDCFALVDAQPTAGNTSFPPHINCHIVIDHHPRIRGYRADFCVIDAAMGATATVLIEWLMISQFVIPADLATALAYALKSETQDLGRETSSRDIKAYLNIYPLASIRKLASIAHPKRPRSYYVSIARTLTRTKSFRNLICAHLGEVPHPEIVAEMADFLLQHRHISWSLCSGRYKKSLVISLRSSNPKARAGKMIKKLVPDRKDAGGHDMFAGGKIDLAERGEEDICRLENKLSDDFGRVMGYSDIEWNVLLEER